MKPKKILILMGVLLMSFNLFGCNSKKTDDKTTVIPAETIVVDYADQNNIPIVSFKLRSLKSTKRDNGGVIKVYYTLTNQMKEYSLTKVVMTFKYLDENKEVIKESSFERYYRQTPIKAGESFETMYALPFAEYDQVTGIEVTIDSAADELAVKPYEPVKTNSYLFDFYNDEEMTNFKNNFYNNLPVRMKYFKAQIQQCEVTDPKIIKEVFEALKKVKVGEESDISITDSEIYFTFIMEDESSVTIAFESKNILSFHSKGYKIISDGGVFEIQIPEN